MNETTPPATGGSVPPQTSGLAIWSLVLGILGLICFSIFSAIPGVICGHQALSKIKRSGGALTGKGLAIAGLITGYLGIVWAIVFIPLMIAIAVPNFIKARTTAQTMMCINNLRQIDAAKQQWASQSGSGAEAMPMPGDLDKFLPAGFAALKCPAGGTYTINRVDTKPTCTIPNHVLPETGESSGSRNQ
jgi:hypothetical protein